MTHMISTLKGWPYSKVLVAPGGVFAAYTICTWAQVQAAYTALGEVLSAFVLLLTFINAWLIFRHHWRRELEETHKVKLPKKGKKKKKVRDDDLCDL